MLYEVITESLSAQDVIHVDLGSAAGLEIGNELMLYRTRTFTKTAQFEADNVVRITSYNVCYTKLLR